MQLLLDWPEVIVNEYPASIPIFFPRSVLSRTQSLRIFHRIVPMTLIQDLVACRHLQELLHEDEP